MTEAQASGDAGRPDPATVRTPAEFVEALRRLKRWTGAGYRELEKRPRRGTTTQTLTAALSRDSLPREDLVAAFVRTWGDDEDQVRRWIDARRRIAAATGWQEPEPGGDTPGEDVAASPSIGSGVFRPASLIPGSRVS